ncbi:MAG TPA: DUF4129 domain-containing protein [Pyrinomonadaceae bacterium]
MIPEDTRNITKRVALSCGFVCLRGSPLSSPLAAKRDRLPLALRRVVVRPASALLLLLVCAQLSQAIPLAEYRERVGSAATALESLSLLYKDEEEEDYAARRAATLRSVRQDIPPSETVEFSGTTMRVENAWLHEALKDYEGLWVSDPRSTSTLKRITERLHALDERLKEVEAGKPEAAAEGKEAGRKRMATILAREEYQKKQAEKGMLARLWERFLKWLASLFPETKPLAPSESRPVSRLAQIIVIALALAVIAYSVWKFAPRLLRRNGRSKGGERGGARVVLGETLAPDQTAADLLAEAEALARAGNLRAAIRKGYIALLCELGDRKVLSLAQHKTNRDYLRAVENRSALHREMQQLTTSFENHWYGFAAATPDDWASFRARYYEALRQ